MVTVFVDDIYKFAQKRVFNAFVAIVDEEHVLIIL